MERTNPVRKVHTSTADLLTWSETPPADPQTPPSRSSRSHQPSDGVGKVVFGGQVTDEEFESLNKRKPCSGYRLKEITGSRIFSLEGEYDTPEYGGANPASRSKTAVRTYQQATAGVSHISFGEEESISPRKPTTLPEVAKQRELSGNLDSKSETKMKKQLSDAKCRELTGHDIFAPPPEILPQTTPTRASALRENFSIRESDSSSPAKGPGEEPVTKTSKKISDKKFADLSGNNIFKDDVPSAYAEKPLSTAKLREISGNDIFADEKVESRDYLGGVRKPPGGHSSITLV